MGAIVWLHFVPGPFHLIILTATWRWKSTEGRAMEMVFHISQLRDGYSVIHLKCFQGSATVA